MFAMLGKVALGALGGIAARVISKTLAEKLAVTALVKLLEWAPDQTGNKLDDELAAEVITALKEPA